MRSLQTPVFIDLQRCRVSILSVFPLIAKVGWGRIGWKRDDNS
ncbi:hypothetical protein HMPREF1870_02775 [Bacteroidales bacterium KA00344]|nr:hypothetical protein HMPREF1870_02775 [Bacteroidales bacterium KA00344]